MRKPEGMARGPGTPGTCRYQENNERTREGEVTETIVAEAADWWTCLCGNEPDERGFYPSSPDGTPLVTDDGTEADGHTAWDGRHHFCAQCGRVVDPATYDPQAGTITVVGRLKSQQ